MAFDAYLQIEGIEGDATDANHLGWIQLQSYSHNVKNETTGQSMGGHHTGGRCHHEDILVIKPLDGSSPSLALACCQGKSHPSAVIELCRSGASGLDMVPYQKVELTDVVVTGVAPKAGENDEFPIEQIRMTYGSIKWTYTKTDTSGRPTGEVVTGWDLKQNTNL
ncbi:MAG: type VI secretion system tube protein Hcp [Chitinivibrionales bacterium]|nr:type VI secretion system tube protein Hcp [Chitinivibrionales bacterium]MBD3358476.1 type VI secretion system tube protein Hcp [Chitinivibrionales bacterium]